MICLAGTDCCCISTGITKYIGEGQATWKVNLAGRSSYKGSRFVGHPVEQNGFGLFFIFQRVELGGILFLCTPILYNPILI